MVKVPPDHPPGADAVSPPCVRLNARSMHTSLVWAGLCMTSDAAWNTKAHFGSGRAPACDPMSNSPPARERGCRKLLLCPGIAQKTEGSRTLDFRFRLRFSSRNRHRTKKTEASRAHRPLARSLNLPRVVQGRHERMTAPHAALAPQYNKSREGQLSWLYFNGLWQIQPRATSPLTECGEFNRGIQSFNGLPQTQPHRPALRGWR